MGYKKSRKCGVAISAKLKQVARKLSIWSNVFLNVKEWKHKNMVQLELQYIDGDDHVG